MEASAKVMSPELVDPFEREVDDGLPEGEDRTAMRLRADYLLQKIADEETRKAEVAEFTARRINMVSDHGKADIAQIDRRIAFLQSRLRMHVPPTGEGMERAFGKKSLSLPHGTFGYRATPNSYHIADMAKAVAWAKGAGVPVKTETTEKVYLADLKAAMERTGEVPDGLEESEGSESFYVKPKVED